MLVTITEEHLNKAINTNGMCNSGKCVVAQAVKSHSHKKTRVLSGCTMNVNEKQYVGRREWDKERINKLIRNFDGEKFGIVRRMLPTTIEIVPK